LPYGVISGLDQALSILEDVQGIGITTFKTADIVRHAMVGRIVAAYDKMGAANSRKVRGA
jgi:phosphate starvation-inducible protein PhoH and related proteins